MSTAAHLAPYQGCNGVVVCPTPISEVQLVTFEVHLIPQPAPMKNTIMAELVVNRSAAALDDPHQPAATRYRTMSYRCARYQINSISAKSTPALTVTARGPGPRQNKRTSSPLSSLQAPSRFQLTPLQSSTCPPHPPPPHADIRC
jgi:hypothetical protein